MSSPISPLAPLAPLGNVRATKLRPLFDFGEGGGGFGGDFGSGLGAPGTEGDFGGGIDVGCLDPSCYDFFAPATGPTMGGNFPGGGGGCDPTIDPGCCDPSIDPNCGGDGGGGGVVVVGTPTTPASGNACGCAIYDLPCRAKCSLRGLMSGGILPGGLSLERIAIFLLGLILIILGIYLFKPTQNIIVNSGKAAAKVAEA